MILRIYITIALLCSVAFAFHGAIEGKVTDSQGKPLIGAQIWLLGEEGGDVSDESGEYSIEVPMHGSHKVVYGYVGFKPETLDVFVPHGERVRKDVLLKEAAVLGKEIEVIEHNPEIHKTTEPVPTTIIPQEAAQKRGATNLGEALELDAGVKVKAKCGMCGAAEISIQGLPGRFSLVLLDGMPLMSGLASKYILMFPIEFMDKIEIVKGASGAIWGSDAVAGVVNIIPPKPIAGSSIKASYTRRSYGSDIFGAFGQGKDIEAFNAMIARSDRSSVDLNGDGYSENIAYSRNIYMGSFSVMPTDELSLNFSGDFADENRQGGPIVPMFELEPNPETEKVYTKRCDVWQQSAWTAGHFETKLRLAYSENHETGFEDAAEYSANQRIVYSELSGKYGFLTLGASFNEEKLMDTRLFDAYGENDFGVWTSAEGEFFGTHSIAAARIDRSSNYGTIFSPYFGTKFDVYNFGLNFAVGTGFRTPSVIFESVQSLRNSYRYAIRRDENLSEEKSLSLEASVDRMFYSDYAASTLRLTFFHHIVSDFINATFEGVDTTTGKALFFYHNVNENVTSSGAELSSQFTFPYGFDATIGGYALIPKTKSGDNVAFINRNGANFSITKHTPAIKLQVTVSGDVNGPMTIEALMPDSTIHKSDSPTFTKINIRALKRFGHFGLQLGMNNIFDFYQEPQTHGSGETEYFWGPIIGREYYGGISVEF